MGNAFANTTTGDQQNTRATFLNQRRDAVYHCLPQQLFSNLNAQKVSLHHFSAALKFTVGAITASQHSRLCIDYLKDRFAIGNVIGGPMKLWDFDSAVADDDGKKWLQDVLALTEELHDVDSTVCLGRMRRDFKFFRVSNTNLSRRFTQHDDGQKPNTISLVL